jgi:hypothetical protein
VRLSRPALVLAAVVSVGIAGAATAAPAGPNLLTFSDPAGDAVPTDAGNDILSVTVTTTGTTAKADKKSTYTPKALVVSMKLAAPPSAVPGTLYEVDSQTSGCGGLFLYFTPGVDGSGGFVDCGSAPDATGSTATNFDVVPEVAGSVVSWTLPLAALPKEMPVGSSISSFAAFSTQTDPASGLVGPYLINDSLNYDNATSDANYKIG